MKLVTPVTAEVALSDLETARQALIPCDDPQMVWIAAGLSNTLISRKLMLQIHAVRNWPLAGFIKNSVGLQLLVAGIHSAISVRVSDAPELPTSGVRENLNLVDQLLHGEFHIQQNTRFEQAVIRKGWRSVTFGVTFFRIWCNMVP